MVICSLKLIVFIFVFLFIVVNFSTQINAKHNKDAIIPFMFSSNRTLTGCKSLTNQHQAKQCEKRAGFLAVLQRTKDLALRSCREQFEYDRWNCNYDKLPFRQMNRERAFIYALYASALMYTTSKACSDGKLEKCYCLEQPRRPKHGNFVWGGCGDNTKKAFKIAKRFLHVEKSKLLQHNINIGLKIVRQFNSKVCVCHGVSASCTLKTCWKVLKPFQEIASELKTKYNTAIKLDNTHSNSGARRLPSDKLVYRAESHSYCNATSGRKCKDSTHCATLCCGRGFNVQQVEVTKLCNCRWQSNPHLRLDYDVCKVNEDVFTCI